MAWLALGTVSLFYLFWLCERTAAQSLKIQTNSSLPNGPVGTNNRPLKSHLLPTPHNGSTKVIKRD